MKSGSFHLARSAAALAVALCLAAPARADSSPARASAGLSQAGAASAAGLSGAASYTVGTVVPGPVGSVLQEGGLSLMQDARRLGTEATEMMRGPLPVTDKTVTVGPPPAEALRAAPQEPLR